MQITKKNYMISLKNIGRLCQGKVKSEIIIYKKKKLLYTGFY